jgi:predicted murein hydrolase (TIGR00659 family)
MNVVTGLLGIILTVTAYFAARRIHKKFTCPFTIPIILSTIFIIIFLAVFNAPYETYMIGGDWINELLGPAVVALAYPLYLHRRTLVKMAGPILIGTAAGAFIGVVSGLLLAKQAGFEEAILHSITTKSVTTPVAMAVTETLGGITSLAAVFVMIAGIGGALMYKYVFRLFRLQSNIGRGLALGSASHAIGTAEAMKNSQLEGSIGTIAMVVSAVVVSLITPGLVFLLL